MIKLQLLIVIMASFLMLFNRGQISQEPIVYGMLAIFFTTAFILYQLPRRIFGHHLFDGVFLILDTLLLCGAIAVNREAQWDLLLFYFFIVFLAAIGASMLKVILGFVVVMLLYVGILMNQGRELAQTMTELLIRFHFLFGVAILYGYLAETANVHKHRAELAEQRERFKMSFVAAIAHDIKNPLGVIISYADILSTRLLRGSGDNTEQLMVAQGIQNNAHKIIGLVTGFLEASKVTAIHWVGSKEPVLINALLKDIARYYEADVSKKKISLKLNLNGANLAVLADPEQLDRVFRNLVGNAAKFTPEGGAINISVAKESPWAKIEIQDTGIGIAEEDIPLLFSQFRRLKNAASIEGTGLGLFIVKTIVEEHGGKVKVSSEEGKGSVFTVYLPEVS